MRKLISKTMPMIRSSRTRFALLVVFLCIVALLGGGSRDDIQSLILLRPITMLFCFIAALYLTRARLAKVAVPLSLLLLFMVWHAVQLVPLPQELWGSLPNRGILAKLGSEMQIGEVWRPISMTPVKTLGSMFTLFGPLTALLLFSNINDRDQRKVLYVLVALAVVSSVWGILQLLGGSGSIFYTYNITNEGYPVGLFANRNHQSVLLAISLLICFWFMAQQHGRSYSKSILASILALYLMALILVTGSRAGLLLSMLALLTGFVLIFRSQLAVIRVPIGRGRSISGRWLLAGFALILAFAGIFLVYIARDVALSRLFQEDTVDDIRYAITPILGRMTGDFYALGSGFGSFEFVFKIYEPAELITNRYLNEAHNDWLQLVIEGGLPAGLLLLSLLGWIAYRAWTLRHVIMNAGDKTLPALFAIIAIGIGSVFDYPLRTPAMATIFVLMVGILATSGVKRSLSESSS